MAKRNERLEVKSWQTKTLFVCQFGKRRLLTSRERLPQDSFWFSGLDYERPEDSRGVHFITNQ